jgi:hypothetical protein
MQISNFGKFVRCDGFNGELITRLKASQGRSVMSVPVASLNGEPGGTT